MLEFLSAKALFEDTYYVVPRFAARCTGTWPATKRSWPVVFLFGYSFFEVALGAVGENVYGCLHLDNFLEALEAFCPAVTKVICVLKISTLFFYHKEFAQIVVIIRKILMKDLTVEKRKIVQEFSSTGNLFSYLLLMSGVMTNIAFNTRPLLVDFLLWWQGKAGIMLLPFNVYLPEVFLHYPLYPLTYLVLMMSGTMSVFTFSASDGFFLCTCSYVSAAFKLLQHDIRKIFAELSTIDIATEQQNLKIRAQLSSIVVRHNQLKDLCAEFSLLVRYTVFMHFLSAAMILGLGILDLLLNFKSIGAFIYILYCFAASMQYYLYCRGGSTVSESSAEVADVMYDIEWYKCDVTTRKMVLMILHASQTMKTIELPFFTASLPAFNSLVTKTGSYVAMLKTFM